MGVSIGWLVSRYKNGRSARAHDEFDSRKIYGMFIL